MNNPTSTRIIFHLVGASTVLLAIVGLVVAYGGFADAWLDANAACGDGTGTNSYRDCAPGEAQGILAIVSFAFLAAGVFSTVLVEFVVRMNAAGRGSGGAGSIRAGGVIDLRHLRSR